ncbi:MAG: mechanosensitive ion channel [Rikenellaceae bacterium]|nr:mechanosensitive ion channel [Rikenellaceae bacterium]
MKFLLQTDDATKVVENLILPDSVQKAQLTETVTKIFSTDYNALLNNLIEQALWIGLKIVLALAIYYVGKWVTRWIIRILDRSFERRNVDLSLRNFLRSMIKVVMTILVILAAIQTLGVNTSSFLAIFASAGLAVGMALSGTLQNFAGGVILLLLRPYRIGDFITAQGQSGTVKSIGLFSTQLSTPDNRIIYVPNSAISSSIVDNYSQPTTRRVDWKVSISYGDDIDVARKEILAMLTQDKRVLNDPAPIVVLAELGNSAVILSVRAWASNADYWDLFWGINERIYKELPQKGIHFPYPQMDIHVKQN